MQAVGAEFDDGQHSSLLLLYMCVCLYFFQLCYTDTLFTEQEVRWYSYSKYAYR